MFNEDDAFEVEEGIKINESGPFITGGPDSPFGKNLSLNTLYLQNTGSGILIFEKVGGSPNDWGQIAPSDSVINRIYNSDFKVDLGKVKFLHEPTFLQNIIVEGCLVVI